MKENSIFSFSEEIYAQLLGLGCLCLLLVISHNKTTARLERIEERLKAQSSYEFVHTNINDLPKAGR